MSFKVLLMFHKYVNKVINDWRTGEIKIRNGDESGNILYIKYLLFHSCSGAWMPVSRSWSSGRNQTLFSNLYTTELQKSTLKSIFIGVEVLTWAYNLSIFVVGLSPSIVNHSSTGSFANLTAAVFPTLRIPSLRTLVIGQWRPRRQTYSKWNSYNYYTLPVS